MKLNMTGVILAGGKNSRMGVNKAFLQVEAERLIDKNVRLLKTIFDHVMIVVAEPREYLHLDAAITTDIFAGKGALGGLYTGLFFSPTQHAFVAACDMPFLNGRFIEYMAQNTDGFDIVVPHPPDGLQPLCAVYSRNCLPAIRNLIDKNSLRIKGFYPGHKTLEISSGVLQSFDPDGNMFANLNTPADLQKYQQSQFLQLAQ